MLATCMDETNMICCHFVFAYYVFIFWGGGGLRSSFKGLCCVLVMILRVELGASSDSLTCEFVPDTHKKEE